MLLIDFNESLDRYEIVFTSQIPSDVFFDLIVFFKQIWLRYDPACRKWWFHKEDGQEKFYWLTHYNYEYTLTPLAKIKKESDVSHPIEFEKYRSRVFDLHLLNKDVELKSHQIEDINFIINQNYSLCANCVGSGKTAVILCAFSYLYFHNHINGIFLVCPSSIAYSWKYEILKFVTIFKDEDIVILNNETKVRPFERFMDKKIIIVPEHLVADVVLSYRDDYTKKKSFKAVRFHDLDIKSLWNKAGIAGVVDESHSLRDMKSLRTRSILSCRRSFAYRYLVTATPGFNHIESIYSSLYFFDPSILNMSENAFKIWLSKSIGTKFDRFKIRSYNEDRVAVLQGKLQPIMLKRSKADIPGWETQVHTKNIYLDMHDLQSRLYKAIWAHEIEILEEEYSQITFKQILNKFHLFYEVIDNPFLLQKRQYTSSVINNLLKQWSLDHDAKFLYLKELIYNLVEDMGKKLIIYTIHPYTNDMLCGIFKKYKPLQIHGQLKIKDKSAHTKEIETIFNTKDDNRILILSALTSSAGLNLNLKCNTIITYEIPGDSIYLKQLMGRTDRLNSIQDSYVHIPYYPNTLDNVRYQRSMNRIAFNDSLDKPLSKTHLQNLLRGMV